MWFYTVWGQKHHIWFCVCVWWRKAQLYSKHNARRVGSSCSKDLLSSLAKSKWELFLFHFNIDWSTNNKIYGINYLDLILCFPTREQLTRIWHLDNECPGRKQWLYLIKCSLKVFPIQTSLRKNNPISKDTYFTYWKF